MSSIKGILWSVVFLLSGLILSVIPTYLIIIYWKWLNSFTLADGVTPIYTIPLLVLFFWIVGLLVAVIYFVAMVRAIIQRKNEDLGIPKAIKIMGLIATIGVISFMVVWYILFQEIAFFGMVPPPVP